MHCIELRGWVRNMTKKNAFLRENVEKSVGRRSFLTTVGAVGSYIICRMKGMSKKCNKKTTIFLCMKML